MKFKFNKWLMLGLASEILVAPNSAVMKHTLLGMNVPYFTFLRYFVVLILCSPALYRMLKQKQLNTESAKDVILSSIFLALAILTFTYAITMTEASYATILGLAGPLAQMPQVIVTPHCSTLTKESRLAMEMEAVANIIKFFKK